MHGLNARLTGLNQPLQTMIFTTLKRRKAIIKYLGFECQQGPSDSVHEDKPSSNTTVFSRIVVHSESQYSAVIEHCKSISPLETHAGSLPHSERRGRHTMIMSILKLQRMILIMILVSIHCSRMYPRHG